MIEWLKDFWDDQIVERVGERTTWDGGVIIGLSLCWILLGGLIDWLAYVALAYGVYTFIVSEK